MTGLGASVVRAALMLTFVLAGKLFDRDAHSVSLLSFVALLMLLYNPAYLNDVGFQMSFLATLGILTTGQTVYHRFKEVKLPEAIKGDVSIPVVAQAWVAPTQMFYFNTFAPYSVFANIALSLESGFANDITPSWIGVTLFAGTATGSPFASIIVF